MVLEQAWKEGVKPCLVLNKLDRLVTELSKSPTEAYYHIRHVLEQVVSVCMCACACPGVMFNSFTDTNTNLRL